MFIEENEEILLFDFLSVKPLGKSSSGSLINIAIIIVIKGTIKVRDIYGNILLQIDNIDEDIVQIAASPSTEDMFFTYITASNKFVI
jgi:hypothetical protein